MVINDRSELKAKARELRSQGLSESKIAKAVEVAAGTIHAWVKDIILTPEQLAEINKSIELARIAGNETKKKLRALNPSKSKRKEGQRKYALAKYHSKGAAYFKKKRFGTKKKLVEIQGGKCVGCGYDKCLRALEFHHRDPNEKDMTLSSTYVGQATWETVCEEVKKCDLLCANCHRERHADPSEMNWKENSPAIFIEG